jgi:hypothetical protein
MVYFTVPAKLYYAITVVVLRENGRSNAVHEVETLAGLKEFLKAEEVLLEAQDIVTKFAIRIKCRSLKHRVSTTLNPLSSDYDFKVVYRAVFYDVAEVWESVAGLQARSSFIDIGGYVKYRLVELPVYRVPQDSDSYESDDDGDDGSGDDGSGDDGFKHHYDHSKSPKAPF